MNAILKWPGGKAKLADRILAETNEKHHTYIEPFVGGGAVFAALATKGWTDKGVILADANADLIQFYSRVRDNGSVLIRFASSFFSGEYSTPEWYYLWRDKMNHDIADGSVMRAAVFLYLNKHSFNGLVRYNRSNEFNVPFGARSKPPKLPRNEIREWSVALKDAVLINDDFGTVMSAHALNGCFVYCDPPYLEVGSKSIYNGNFDLIDHQQLDQLSHIAASRGAKVVISGSNNDATMGAYKSASRVVFTNEPTNISGKASGRGNRSGALYIYE